MSSSRDYLSDLRRYYLPQAKTRVSNAWYRAAGRHIQGGRARLSNWRNGKAIARGRRDVAARAGDQVRSRTPVLRGRTDRRTGRPNRDAARLGRQQDVTLGWRQTHRAPMPRARTGRSR